MLTESDLLPLALNLDSNALAQIYDLYSPAIYRYAMRLLGNTSLAEECVAETFSRLLQILHAGKGPREHLQAYLYRVAHNWITDQYRRELPAEELSEMMPAGIETPEELSVLHIRQAHLREAIQQLTPDQQQVIALKYLEDFDNEEIARTTRKPIGAVKALQHRALASLQRLLLEKELV
ncbi:MAG: sigma-70 family RNA polymerase sigma factor [Anaerolineales bacterium]|nr:sigma-70 family RNA polymerase sigma factor [Anaerolineales bacterium]